MNMDFQPLVVVYGVSVVGVEYFLITSGKATYCKTGRTEKSHRIGQFAISLVAPKRAGKYTLHNI